MKALKINHIKNAELLTARLLTEREKGLYDLHTSHINQTNSIVDKIMKQDIYSFTNEDMKELGEYINKVQTLLQLLDSKDVLVFTKVLETSDKYRKKYNKEKILEIISRQNYNTREIFNLRIKVYSYALELNINTCHYVINKYLSGETSTYNKIQFNNLIECIWSGLSPEEIKIMFQLSEGETHLLHERLYIEKNAMIQKLGENYGTWKNLYVSTSEEVGAVLNERLVGNFKKKTKKPATYYENNLFDITSVESAKTSAKLAAELSVKTLFYLTLYPSMSVKTLKEQVEELVKKDHEWSKAQIAEIKRLGKTKKQYILDLKDILADESGEMLMVMKRNTLASICQLDEDYAEMIDDMYVCVNPSELQISFIDICNIITLMRTDIKTECIQYLFALDEETTKNVGKLFKARISEQSKSTEE